MQESTEPPSARQGSEIQNEPTLSATMNLTIPGAAAVPPKTAQPYYRMPKQPDAARQSQKRLSPPSMFSPRTPQTARAFIRAPSERNVGRSAYASAPVTPRQTDTFRRHRFLPDPSSSSRLSPRSSLQRSALRTPTLPELLVPLQWNKGGPRPRAPTSDGRKPRPRLGVRYQDIGLSLEDLLAEPPSAALSPFALLLRPPPLDPLRARLLMAVQSRRLLEERLPSLIEHIIDAQTRRGLLKPLEHKPVIGLQVPTV